MDVLMLGPGTAGVAEAAALAQSLGMPVEAVVQRVYRAPARLLAGLPDTAARRIAELLQATGFEAEAAPEDQALVAPELLDVAAEVLDPAQTEAVVTVLSAFLGVSGAQALDLLHNPPGLILGGASPAAVAALQRRLPPGAVRLGLSNPARAHYTLLAAAWSRSHQALVRGLLPEARPAHECPEVVAHDLERSVADRLWARLQTHEGVRIADQAFLRFDVRLLAIDPAAPAAADALCRLAGVPPVAFNTLQTLLPVTVEQGLGWADLADRLAAYRAAGLHVAAHLCTFERLAIEVLQAPAGVLMALGLDGAQAPVRTSAMTRARAHWLRHRLEAAGADVVFSATGD